MLFSRRRLEPHARDDAAVRAVRRQRRSGRLYIAMNQPYGVLKKRLPIRIANGAGRVPWSR